jgi:hypothetical protein
MNSETGWMYRTIAAVLMVAGGLLAACSGTDGSEPTSRAPVVEGSIEAGSPAVVGEEIRLDASGSFDPEGQELTFAWQVVEQPDGSSAEVGDGESVVARFTPDAAGEYVFEVAVSDGEQTASGRFRLDVVEASSEPPVAEAGADVTLSVGSEAVLDASGSSDPDGDSLEYAWAFVSKPGASEAALEPSEGVITSFVLDVPGTYEVELTVTDGEREAMDTVVVRANRAPVADAGADTETEVGELVELDGSGSSDPDGDELSYGWEVVSAPNGGDVQLENADQVAAEFTPDQAGLYVVELTVDDGTVEASDRRTIRVLPGGGSGSSTLYLSPDGDDANPGTESEPMATLGAGLAEVSSSGTITRLELAAGTYDQGANEHGIEQDLEIVGPQEGDKPVLVGSSNLLSIEGQAFVTLVRLELEAGGTAVKVADEAAVSAAQIDCRARRCVSSGALPSPPGGRVSIQQSTLTSTGDGGHGISAARSDEVSVVQTTIEGFSGGGRGIRVADSPVILRDSTVRGNGVGVEVLGSSSQNATLIRDSQFVGNDIGLKNTNASNVTVRETTIEGSIETGLLAAGGSTRLESSSVKSGEDHGVVVRDGTSEGTLVTARQSTVQSNLGDGIRVEGKAVTLDLGNETTGGSNEVRFNKGVALNDVRPDDGTGRVTLQSTRLDSRYPPVGSYEGPNYRQWGMRIANRNSVIVY